MSRLSRGGGLSISPPQLPGGGTPHTHPISDIVDLQMSLNARAMQTSLDATNAQVALKAPLVHGHIIADVSGLQAALDGKASAGHVHAVADITGLVGALAAKSDVGHAHVISDVSGLQTALDGKSATGHGHSNFSTSGAGFVPAPTAGDVTALRVLRADGAWVDQTGGGGGPHTHPISDITGLQAALDGKAAASHTHAIADVTGLQTALDGKAAVSHTHAQSEITNLVTDLAGKAAVSHTHTIANVTGLQTALDGKAATSHSHVIADVTGLQTALDGKAAASHTHAQSEITNLVTDLAGKAASVHSHAIADVTGLQTALDGKAASSHSHAIADVTGLQTALDGKAASGHTHSNFAENSAGFVPGPNNTAVTNGYVLVADGTWAARAALVHSHAIADVTGLQTALDGKAASSHSHAIADVTGLQTALDGKSATSHSHSNFTTSTAGFVPGPTAGEVSGNKYLRADGSWQDPPGGGAHTHVIADVTGLQAALDGKAAASHTHAIADVTGLQTALDGKAAASHTHAQTDVTGLTTALAGKSDTGHSHGNFSTSTAGFVPGPTAGDVSSAHVLTAAGTWVAKANATHTHAIADVTGLQTALDGKAASSHTHAIADVTGLQTALDGKAAASHTHAQSDITGLVSALAGKSDAGHSHGNFSTSTAGFVPGPTAGDVSSAHVLTAAGTWVAKANATHTHAIADVTGLQTALDGKSGTGHTHSNFTTSTPGFVPGPTAGEVTDGKFLKADGSWATPAGGGGGSTIYPHANFGPLDAEFPTSSFPQLQTVNVRPVLSYDATVAESVYWTDIAPASGWSTVVVEIFYMMASATSGNVRWCAAIEAITPGDAIDLNASDSFDTDNVVDNAVPASALNMKSVTITLTTKDSIAAGDYYRLRIKRDGAHANDTATGDAHFLRAQMRFT